DQSYGKNRDADVEVGLGIRGEPVRSRRPELVRLNRRQRGKLSIGVRARRAEYHVCEIGLLAIAWRLHNREVESEGLAPASAAEQVDLFQATAVIAHDGREIADRN